MSGARGLHPGPTPGAANRARNGPDQAISNPASRVQPSGEFVLFNSSTLIPSLSDKSNLAAVCFETTVISLWPKSEKSNKCKHFTIIHIISGNASPRAISRAERERKVSMRLHRGAPANVSSSDLTGRHDQSRISTSQV